MVSVPSEADVRLALQAGPAGARLASQWFDAVIASLPSRPLSEIPNADEVRPAAQAPGAPSRPRACKLSATNPERYGWRWWALRPDGVLVSPIRGVEVARRGSIFDAQCGCGSPASPDCSCGIHYVLRPMDLAIYVAHCLANWAWQYPTLQRLSGGSWTSVLAYGVAVGAVAVDKTRHVDMPARRAERFHMLTLMSSRLTLAQQVELARRYGCEVIPETSVEACRAVANRLGSSLSAYKMSESERRPAAPLV